METQAAFVGADGAIELHTVTNVYLYLALVVDPGHTESSDTLWLYDALYDFGFLKLGVLVVHILNAVQHLSYCL